MTVKSWNVGDVLTAADMNSWTVPLAAYKGADTSRTASSLTLTADPDLSVTVAANCVYAVTCVIVYQMTAGNTSLEWNFTVPSGATGTYGGGYVQPGPTTGFWGSAWATSVQAAAADGLIHGINFQGTLIAGSTGGAFTYVWGLNPTGSSTLKISTGSNLIAQRIG